MVIPLSDLLSGMLLLGKSMKGFSFGRYTSLKDIWDKPFEANPWPCYHICLSCF